MGGGLGPLQLVLLILGWLHAQTVGPLVDWLDEALLGAWEESVKLFIRELFVAATRLINGSCAWALALFDAGYRDSLRCTWQQKEAWHSWWREERQSTLNAVLAAQCSSKHPGDGGAAQQQQRAPAPAAQAGRLRFSDGAPAARSSSMSSGHHHRHGARISWQQDEAAAGGAAPAGAAGGRAARAASAAPRRSWVARLIWRLEVDLLGRTAASTAVGAAATGRSSNPLLQHLPSMPSMPSLPSLLPAGSGSNLAAPGIEEALAGEPYAYVWKGPPLGAEGGAAAAAAAAAAADEPLPAQRSWAASVAVALLAWPLRAAGLLVLLPLLPLKWLSAAGMRLFLPWGNARATQLGLGGGAAGGHPLADVPPRAAATAAAAAAVAAVVGAPAARVAAQHNPQLQQLQLQDQPGAAAAAATTAAPAVRRRQLRRSIVFEQPSGFGAHEGSKRRGLLEELCLAGELCVTAVFDAMRWLVRLLTLTRPRPHSHHTGMTAAAARQQRRLAAAAAAAPPGSPGRRLAMRGGGGRPRSPPMARAGGGGRGGRRPWWRIWQAAETSEQHGGAQPEPREQQVLSPGVCSWDDSSSSCSSDDEDERASWGSGSRPHASPLCLPLGLQRSKSAGADLAQLHRGTARGSSALPRLTLRRVRSVGRWGHDVGGAGAGAAAGAAASASGGAIEGGDDELSPAAQMILKAGYPLELHTVVTADGYVLRMERIPRTGCARVAFFQHGILDTSLTWVSSGVTGSQAFAAWDQGFDVWLGSSRSNPPREARDPAKQGLAYFSFSLNELGLLDMPAQLDHLHAVKTQELGGAAAAVAAAAAAAAAASARPGGDAAAAATYCLRHLDPLLAASHPGQFGIGGPAAGAGGDALLAAEAVFASAPPRPLAQGGGGVPSAAAVAVAAAAAGAETLGRWLRGGTGGGGGAGIAGAGAGGGGGRLKRTLSDSQLDAMALDSDRQSSQGCGDASSISSGGLQDADGKRRRRRARFGVLQRLLRGAVAGGRERQQQKREQQLREQMQQQEEQQAAEALRRRRSRLASMRIEVPADGDAASSEPPSPAAAAAAAVGGPGAPAAGEGLEQLLPEVREPSTPELVESPRRIDSLQPAASGGSGAAPLLSSDGEVEAREVEGPQRPAAMAAALGAAAAGRQGQPAPPAPLAAAGAPATPFMAPAAQQAAVGSLMGDAVTVPPPQQRHQQPAATLQQQQQQQRRRQDSVKLPFLAMRSSRTSSGGDGGGSGLSAGLMRRSKSSQALMSAASQALQLPAALLGGAAAAAATLPAVDTLGAADQGIRPAAAAAAARAPALPSLARRTAPAAAQSPPPTAAQRQQQQHQQQPEPYDLRLVAHSLGGMSSLIYCVARCAAGQPHHVRRLVLMSPAGFHNRVPAPWWPFILVLPWWHRLLALLLGRHRACHPAVLPTYIGRALTFSAFLEVARLPALADFTRAALKLFFGGDASEWERALLMPHYSAAGMPACSLHQALHFIQIIHSGRFQLYDYGSPAANAARYGSPRPPNIGSQYWRLGALPVDLMAGSGDGIIPPANVRCHHARMREQGLQVSYREFDHGHMDFTFSVKDELRYYVLRCLSARS